MFSNNSKIILVLSLIPYSLWVFGLVISGGVLSFSGIIGIYIAALMVYGTSSYNKNASFLSIAAMVIIAIYLVFDGMIGFESPLVSSTFGIFILMWYGFLHFLKGKVKTYTEAKNNSK